MASTACTLLAYLFDAGYPDLAAELGRIRDDRVLRAPAMVSRLADLGVNITWDQVAAIASQAVVGRPHIARAMAASGAIASPREAFTRDWIADGDRATSTGTRSIQSTRSAWSVTPAASRCWLTRGRGVTG